MQIGDRRVIMVPLVPLALLVHNFVGASASTIVRRAEVASGGAIEMAILPGKLAPELDNGSLVLNRVDTCQQRSDECQERSDSGAPAKRIAVYTYVTGAYEDIRDFNVPCVPSGVDAFFILDDATRTSASSEKLDLWRKHGWWILTMLPTMEGTSEVPKARFAAKSLKFTPPSWLLNGTWDWLVEFDGDISMDMAKLRPLLDRYSDKSLVLLKWYWKECQPWDCFLWECEDMLQNRKEYVETSYERIVKWKEQMKKLHEDPKHPFVPAAYYELSVMFRNVAHARADEIKDAFRQVLEQCRTIQRDQFLMPFFLWNSSLEQDVAAIPIDMLYSDLKYCKVDTRNARNLLAHRDVHANSDINATGRQDLDVDTMDSWPNEFSPELHFEPPLTG